MKHAVDQRVLDHQQDERLDEQLVFLDERMGRADRSVKLLGGRCPRLIVHHCRTGFEGVWISLVESKLKTQASPNDPTGLPLTLEPSEPAQSSSTIAWYLRAISIVRSISHGMPY